MKDNTMKNKLGSLSKQVGQLLAITSLIMLESCGGNPTASGTLGNTPTPSSSTSRNEPKTPEEQASEDFKKGMEDLEKKIDQLKTLPPVTQAEKAELIKQGEEAIDNKMSLAERQELESTLNTIGSSTPELIELLASINVNPSEVIYDLSQLSLESLEGKIGTMFLVNYFKGKRPSIIEAQAKNQPRNNY